MYTYIISKDIISGNNVNHHYPITWLLLWTQDAVDGVDGLERGDSDVVTLSATCQVEMGPLVG